MIEMLLTLLSCSCSPSVLRNSGSMSSVLRRSKEEMPMRSLGSTCPFSHRKMVALGLSLRSRSSMAGSSASGTRSVLLSKMRSAKATCSAASFSTPSGFSSSMRARMCFESQTVMIASRENLAWMSSSTKKVCATGAGSARPVVSRRTRSKESLRSLSCVRARTRSPRTVQQAQPLSIEMTSSAEERFSLTRASSMLTAPNSFSMTQIRLPCCSRRM
mmetsp:Transcript_49164/g.155620  ORF Transcript_49164/g.155620 Transcript_49164/m.155620 type:complete len:217 (+) Transcript_49164:852-1502(+)